jgi:hypothetical protein
VTFWFGLTVAGVTLKSEKANVSVESAVAAGEEVVTGEEPDGAAAFELVEEAEVCATDSGKPLIANIVKCETEADTSFADVLTAEASLIQSDPFQ